MKRCVTLLLLLFCSIALITHESNATIQVYFDPNPVEIAIGSHFDLDIFADIPNDDLLTGFGLDLLYDDTLIELDSYEVNRTLFPEDTNGGISSGHIDGLFGWTNRPDRVYGDEVLLATLHLICIGEGWTGIDLTKLDDEFGYLDYFGGAFFWSSPLPIGGGYGSRDWSYVSASVTQTSGPNPVPESATILLIGTGLLGTAGLCRKKFFKK